MTLFQPCLRASHLHNFRPLERNSCASSRRRLKEGQHDEAVMLCDMSCWLASGPLPAKVAPRGNPHVPTCTPPCPPKFTCSGIDVNSPTMAYYLPFSWGNPLKSRRGMKASPNGNCPFFERLCVYNRLHFRRRLWWEYFQWYLKESRDRGKKVGIGWLFSYAPKNCEQC